MVALLVDPLLLSYFVYTLVILGSFPLGYVFMLVLKPQFADLPATKKLSYAFVFGVLIAIVGVAAAIVIAPYMLFLVLLASFFLFFAVYHVRSTLPQQQPVVSKTPTQKPTQSLVVIKGEQPVEASTSTTPETPVKKGFFARLFGGKKVIRPSKPKSEEEEILEELREQIKPEVTEQPQEQPKRPVHGRFRHNLPSTKSKETPKAEKPSEKRVRHHRHREAKASEESPVAEVPSTATASTEEITPIEPISESGENVTGVPTLELIGESKEQPSQELEEKPEKEVEEGLEALSEEETELPSLPDIEMPEIGELPAPESKKNKKKKDEGNT